MRNEPDKELRQDGFANFFMKLIPDTPRRNPATGETFIKKAHYKAKSRLYYKFQRLADELNKEL